MYDLIQMIFLLKKNRVFHIIRAKYGFYCVIRIEETNLVCVISRKYILGEKIFGIGSPEIVFKWSQNGPECYQIVPNRPPPPTTHTHTHPHPHPHPWRQQKSPARGQNILF